MRVLISADIEGISGISNKGQVVKDSVRYDLTCELYIKEVNAAIKALKLLIINPDIFSTDPLNSSMRCTII